MEELKGSKRWAILIVVLMSTFMASLDGSIVNVALPIITKKLNVVSSSVQLVVTSYLIVIVGSVLIFGRLGDILGKAKVFKVGIALFTVGSLLCGLTTSFTLLIIARAIQGIGAAAAMATNQGIITEVFPRSERGKALGFLGTSVALGSLVGPGLGGIIIGASSWEYIFLINVPVGLVALFLSFKLLPKDIEISKEKLDILGAVLLILTIVPLFSALSTGVSRGFTDKLILLGFAIAMVSFIAFVYVEIKVEKPLVDFKIFKNKLFSLSILCGFIAFIAIFCNNITLPFYLQDVMSFSPQKAGFILMIYPLLLTVIAPLSGQLSDRVGSEILTFVGLLCISLGLLLISTLNEASSLPTIITFIVIVAVGMGLFQPPNNSLIMSTVKRDKLGIAGSINALIRNLGMICGIALSTTLLYSMMSYKIGYTVTNYVVGRNDIFVYGMKAVYITAAIVCFIGAILTFLRLRSKEIKFKD